jgi:hypothetical protein
MEILLIVESNVTLPVLGSKYCNEDILLFSAVVFLDDAGIFNTVCLSLTVVLFVHRLCFTLSVVSDSAFIICLSDG